MRLIDADSLIADVESTASTTKDMIKKQYSTFDVCNIIAKAPTYIRSLRKHGYWINSLARFVKDERGRDALKITLCACSICLGSIPPYREDIFEYCPHCGAVMDAEPPEAKE